MLNSLKTMACIQPGKRTQTLRDVPTPLRSMQLFHKAPFLAAINKIKGWFPLTPFRQSTVFIDP